MLARQVEVNQATGIASENSLAGRGSLFCSRRRSCGPL